MARPAEKRPIVQFYAIVSTYDDAPDAPWLHSAWPASWGRDGDLGDDGGAPAALADLRDDPTTVAADVVLIDVPDAPLLALLSRAAAAIPGVLLS
jgi:hypothetical protein